MPKGPRKFHFSFEKTGLTRFGGLSLFQSFLQISRPYVISCSSTFTGPIIVAGAIIPPIFF
jgi:hypothetical protein